MQYEQNDMTPDDAARALRWLAEMGADEIIGGEPVDRRIAPTAEKSAPATSTPAMPPAVVARPSPKPAASPAVHVTAASIADLRTLAEIEQALSGFDACPLKKTATRLCFADGNPQARVMIVGEAPGRDEDIEGKPFVGKSGQLLDRMLTAIGLSRQSVEPASSVFITNAIFWRPPGNRTPTEAETLMCLPFLLRTIEIQKPDVIVCLGATPAHRLTGKSEGIVKLRGKWLNLNISGRSIPLLPTLHPAYLLRQPNQKRLSWRDMLALRQMLDAP